MDAQEAAIFAVGIVSSVAVGYLAIKFLLHFLSRRGLGTFAYYRFAPAAVDGVALLP